MAPILLTSLILAAIATAQPSPVVQLQNLAHTTDRLERTVPFYRDVLGLPLNGARDPLAAQPQELDEGCRSSPRRRP